jgi:hypothetical protein
MSLYAVTRFYPTFILFSVAWLTTLLVPQYAEGLSDTSISQPLILLLAYTILVVFRHINLLRFRLGLRVLRCCKTSHYYGRTLRMEIGESAL